MTPSGSQNAECYARALGGCSSAVSAEHFISRSVLKQVGSSKAGNPSTYGRNLAFREPGVKELMDIGRLTSRILCTKHNSDLAPFDSAGKGLLKAAEDLHLALVSPARREGIVSISGDDCERWLLKTLCGSLYSGKIWRDLAELNRVCPPIEWLEYLFLNLPFPAGQGIYWQPSDLSGLTLDDRSELEFHPLMLNDNQVVGGLRVWLFGLRFDLVVANLAHEAISVYSQDRYRPERIRLVGRGDGIHFTWKSGAGSREILIGTTGAPSQSLPQAVRNDDEPAAGVN